MFIVENFTSVFSSVKVLFFFCRYNPDRYAGMDEDDSDMEVGFDVIQKEERVRYIFFFIILHPGVSRGSNSISCLFVQLNHVYSYS